jgi:hypothetical protein
MQFRREGWAIGKDKKEKGWDEKEGQGMKTVAHIAPHDAKKMWWGWQRKGDCL